MKVVFLSLLLLVSSVHCLDLRIDPLVVIGQGLVRGQRATDGDYTTFLGVPYATVNEESPFGPAQPPPYFGFDIFRANDGSIRCPQTDTSNSDTQSLDCLRVNIFVPNDATSENPLPVLAWIHGGEFTSGSAGEYNPRELVKQGIVVVTINYRLGPYGFLCLDVPSVPGNQGLKDQYAALRWIRSNIGGFGGNPYNVTIAGQGAGACSALLHLYSYREKLFHKVIVESGSPQSEGMFVNSDINAAIKLSEQLGVNLNSSEEAIDYLINTPYNLVVAAASEIGLELGPCKERSFSGVDNFVESDPYSLSNERKVRDTPILIGHTSKEQINTIQYRPGYYETDPFYEKLARYYNLNDNILNRISSTVRHYYVGDRDISVETVSELEDFESDFRFNHPIQNYITKLLNENANPVYEYVFSYVRDSPAQGAAHAAELRYLFGSSNNALTKEEQNVTESMVTLWANFIKFGNPTPTNSQSVTWTPISSDFRPYLVIDDNIRMESRVFNGRMAFWDLFFENYGSYNIFARDCSTRA